MFRRIAWLWLAATIVLAGCGSGELDSNNLEPEALPVQESPAANPSPSAEALKAVTASPVLETTTEPTAVTPFLEEVNDMQESESMAKDEAAQARIEYARTDLAGKIGVEVSSVELVGYKNTIWRDGSLGCPKEGMMYTQSLVDGYFIQLNVDGQLYDYHGANGRDPFLCTESIAGDSLPGPIRSGELATPPGG